MQDLIESQKQYQVLLKQVLDDHRQQVEAVQQLLESRKALCPRCDSICYSNSLGYNSQTSINSPITENVTTSSVGPSQAPHFPSISVASPATDTRLVKWMQGLGVDNFSIDRVLNEEYTLDDILFHCTRDDLRRLHLR